MWHWRDFVRAEIPNYDTELLCLNKVQDKCCSLVLSLVPRWVFLLSLHSPRLSQHSLAVDWRTCGQNLASNFVLHSWHQVMARHTQCKYVFLTQALGFLTPSWTLWLEFHLIFFFFFVLVGFVFSRLAGFWQEPSGICWNHLRLSAAPALTDLWFPLSALLHFLSVRGPDETLSDCFILK